MMSNYGCGILASQIKEKDVRPIICVDFDGVIHSFVSGYKGITNIPDPPVAGAIEWLERYLDPPDGLWRSEVQIMIYSSRSRSWRGRRAMKRWFVKYMGREYTQVLKFPKNKPAAFLTIDDRAICFEGKFPTEELMLKFKPWYER